MSDGEEEEARGYSWSRPDCTGFKPEEYCHFHWKIVTGSSRWSWQRPGDLMVLLSSSSYGLPDMRSTPHTATLGQARSSPVAMGTFLRRYIMLVVPSSPLEAVLSPRRCRTGTQHSLCSDSYLVWYRTVLSFLLRLSSAVHSTSRSF